jgi:E3 ubiquitin-protein ligase TRIP12
MTKAKAKAERAATRCQAQSAHEGLLDAEEATPQPVDATTASAVVEAENPNIGATAEPTSITSTVVVEQVANRLELLQTKPSVMTRFIRLMVPVLVDVYAASVLTNVRIRSLSGILKAVNFLEVAALENILKVLAHVALSSDASDRLFAMISDGAHLKLLCINFVIQ